jgi:hypothetical protein
MKTLEEFTKEFYPEIFKAYGRYLVKDNVLPIGTKIITLRAGFGGSGWNRRIIGGYQTLNWVKTKNPEKAKFYILTYPKEYKRTEEFLSCIENSWKDFEINNE